MKTVIKKLFVEKELLAKALLFIIVPFVMIGCGDDSSTPAVGTTTVTAVDGYVKNATLTDNGGKVGTYTSNGQYTFSGSVAYPLTLTGGALEDTNASFDINMTAQSGLVISPITTFLENNASLQTKLAIALSVSDSIDSFAVDYVDTNNTDLAKLSQLLYMVETNATLKNAFKLRVAGANPASLNDIFTLAEADVNATMGIQGITYRAFLTAVKAINGSVSAYETTLNITKTDLNFDFTPTHNGTTYASVISPYTGKIWLDRNLGASQVCTVLNDTACYGDYYQWGRATDGHEKTTSTPTATLATTITAANSNFITNSTVSPLDWTTADSNGSLRNTNWSKTDGSSVCPVGYRVPTITELTLETTSASTPVANNTDAFNSFLKLPSAGNRNGGDGSWNNVSGTEGKVWSSSVSGGSSGYLFFTNSAANKFDLGTRAYGFSVRCLKD